MSRSIWVSVISLIVVQAAFAEDIPTGAVLPFVGRSDCPKRWEQLPKSDGLYLVGASAALKFDVGKVVGNDQIAIAPENLPAHAGTVALKVLPVNSNNTGTQNTDFEVFGQGEANWTGVRPAALTVAIGGKTLANPIANYPAAIAVLYCVKN